MISKLIKVNLPLYRSAVGKNPEDAFAVDQLVKINSIEGVKVYCHILDFTGVTVIF